MIKSLKRAIKEINQKQNGQVLVLVLIVLALGGIILAPTLNYTASSLKHQQVHETKTLELYSADSGIASALVALSSGNTMVTPYTLNGRTVSANVTNLGDGNWLITSTASSPDGSSTTIRTGVSSSGGFDFLLDNAITSYGDVTIKGTVTGNVTAGGDVDDKGDVDGTITEDYAFSSWPTSTYLADYYAGDVDMNSPEYLGGELDLDGVSQSVGPSYVNNDLDIVNNNKTSANLTLDGTLYITGQTTIGKSKDFILNLNGQTIFIEDDTTGGGKACWIAENCQIVGSGCIIAVGDIYFSPKGDVGDENNFVFIFSIEGMIDMNPNGDFYGSIAGNIQVDQQPGNELVWNTIGTEGGLNFPMEAGVLGGSTEEMVIGGWNIS